MVKMVVMMMAMWLMVNGDDDSGDAEDDVYDCDANC